MGEKSSGKRTVAVALFFTVLCMIATACFQMKTNNILRELATVPLRASALETEMPSTNFSITSNAVTTLPAPDATQPSVSQIQNTQSVQHLQKANTEKLTTTRPQTEKNTEIRF